MEEGDASADSNDALRYERPRPPAAPSRSAADVKANASAVSSPAPAEGAPAAAKPTQFAYAGQVHGLYRFGAAANGFKPVTDTGPFGVVLVGAGLAYSLIVYNAAKQYIVVTPVDGTLRPESQSGPYVSFADANRVLYSLAFPTVEAADAFRLATAAVRCHAKAHGAGEEATSVEVVSLSGGSTSAGDEAGVPLTAGATATVEAAVRYLTQGADEVPKDVLTAPTLLTLSAEEGKVRMGKGRDPVGGLSEALEGSRRGDRIVAFLPSAAVSRGSAPAGYDGSSWLVADMRVVKARPPKRKKQGKSEGSAAEASGGADCVAASVAAEEETHDRTPADSGSGQAPAAANGGQTPVRGSGEEEEEEEEEVARAARAPPPPPPRRDSQAAAPDPALVSRMAHLASASRSEGGANAVIMAEAMAARSRSGSVASQTAATPASDDWAPEAAPEPAPATRISQDPSVEAGLALVAVPDDGDDAASSASAAVSAPVAAPAPAPAPVSAPAVDGGVAALLQSQLGQLHTTAGGIDARVRDALEKLDRLMVAVREGAARVEGGPAAPGEDAGDAGKTASAAVARLVNERDALRARAQEAEEALAAANKEAEALRSKQGAAVERQLDLHEEVRTSQRRCVELVEQVGSLREELAQARRQNGTSAAMQQQQQQQQQQQEKAEADRAAESDLARRVDEAEDARTRVEEQAASEAAQHKAVQRKAEEELSQARAEAAAWERRARDAERGKEQALEQARAEVSRLRAQSRAAVAERLRSIMGRLFEAASAEFGSLGDGLTQEAATAALRRHIKDITRRATRQGPSASPSAREGGQPPAVTATATEGAGPNDTAATAPEGGSDGPASAAEGSPGLSPQETGQGEEEEEEDNVAGGENKHEAAEGEEGSA